MSRAYDRDLPRTRGSGGRGGGGDFNHGLLMSKSLSEETGSGCARSYDSRKIINGQN